MIAIGRLHLMLWATFGETDHSTPLCRTMFQHPRREKMKEKRYESTS